MSEHLSTPSNDKDLIAPTSDSWSEGRPALVPGFGSDGRPDGSINVMQVKSIENGIVKVVGVSPNGEELEITGDAKALSEKVQSHYAHKLAMDRNPTPEQMERGTPPVVIAELGDVALEAAMNLPAPAEVADTSSPERGSNQGTEFDIKQVEGTVGTLRYATENLRHLPEAEAKHELNVHIVRQASNAHDMLQAGRIDKASYSAMTHALLGAASNYRIIDVVSDQLMDGKALDSDEKADLSDCRVELYEIAAKTGLDADIARIRFADNLISRSEYILEQNGGVANDRYRAMVGFIAGLSTQIKDSSASFGYTSGALEQLKKHS